MDTPLTQTEIIECQNKFNLDYHISYSQDCLKMAGFDGKNVLEVGGSLPEEFVFDYLKVKSWTAIETAEYEKSLLEVGGSSHTGTILKQEDKKTYEGFEKQQLSNYNFHLANIEDLPEKFFAQFDLIFSIAAFEHIHKFPLALEKMYHALKPSGLLFARWSPIWSGHDGHHLPLIIDSQGNKIDFGNSPIPHWGHLQMSPPELYTHLRTFIDKKTASLILYYVYNSSNINRFFTEDYFDFIQQSPFKIIKLNPTFLHPIPSETQISLETRFPGRKYFSNNGILALLKKPPLDAQIKISNFPGNEQSLDIQIKSHVESMNLQGEAFFKNNDYDAALNCFLIALKADNCDTLTHNNLGVYYWQTGNISKAIEHLKMALEIDPSHRATHLNQIEALKALGTSRKQLP